MSTHTPGPWFVEGDNSIAAKLDNGPFVWIAMANPFNDVLVSEETVNARLIAAAPELLEALEGAIRSLEWWQRNEPGSFGNTEAARLEIARTAITRARPEPSP